jgi:predicted phosphodiesterase
MNEKQLFYDWWKSNGCRGISYCENNYRKISSRKIREYLKEFEEENKSKHKEKNKQRIVQINDLHIPYHDKKTIEVFLKFLRDVKIDKLVIAGDLLDFYELSTFDKDPMRKYNIQDEIDQCYEILKELKKYCPEIHFIKGNHEDRLRRFLWKNPSLASIKVLELSKLLNMDTLGIEYHDFEYIFRRFRFTHGSIVRQDSGATAKAELLKYGSSMSSGHTHRLSMFIKTDARGTVGAYEGGCMCNLNPEYIQGVPNWQQGFLVFDFDGDRFFCQVVPILDHKFIFGKKKYE